MAAAWRWRCLSLVSVFFALFLCAQLLPSFQASRVLVCHFAEYKCCTYPKSSKLTEFQLLLLAESVEKMIVSMQLALVESILNNGSRKKEWKFAVDAQKISEEDLNITGALIELSGATVQKRGTCLAGTGNPAAFSALSALYVALYALNLLHAS